MANITYVGGNTGMTTRGLADSTDDFAYLNAVQIVGGYRFDLFNITTSEFAGTIEYYGNLTLNAQNELSAGTVTGMKFTETDGEYWQVRMDLPAAALFADGIAAALAGSDTIVGGILGDDLWGHRGSDKINGADGNDLLVGGKGNDTLIGGKGFDILSYRDRTRSESVLVKLSETGNGEVLVVVGKETDKYFGIEGLEGGAGGDWLEGNDTSNEIYGGNGNDKIYGRGGDDYLDGDSDNDTLLGGWGHDLLVGGSGNDRLFGDTGNDLISYRDRNSAVVVVLHFTGSGTVVLGSEIDEYSGIEGLQGGSGNDSLTGNFFDNDLLGGNGNDTVSGLEGDDNLIGNAGNDRLLGGDGDDWLTGGDGNDRLNGGNGMQDGASYNNAAAGVTVNLNLQGSTQNTLGGGMDTLFSIEGLEGSSFADILQGNSADNSLYGLGGNDSLFGAEGNDILVGHEGDDALSGDNGDDIILGGLGRDIIDGGIGIDLAEFSDAASGVRIDLNYQNVFRNTFGLGFDKLISIENLFGSNFNDNLSGDVNNNYIWGWLGNDIINGGEGEDMLFGQHGNDRLTGGAGRDKFVFDIHLLGFDTITDLDFTGADKDVIEFYGVFTDFNDFMAAGIQTAAGFRVTLEAGSTVLFSGRTAADLAQADFGFYL